MSGDIPSTGGVALSTWGGGSIDEMEHVAAQSGCALDSVWTATGGNLVGHLIGALEFVNDAFTAEHGSSSLPPGTTVVLVCSEGTDAADGTSIPDLLLTVDDWEPGAAVAEEGCVNLATVPYAARAFDGLSGYLEFDGAQAYMGTSGVLLFASDVSAQARPLALLAGAGAHDRTLELGSDLGVRARVDLVAR